MLDIQGFAQPCTCSSRVSQMLSDSNLRDEPANVIVPTNVVVLSVDGTAAVSIVELNELRYVSLGITFETSTRTPEYATSFVYAASCNVCCCCASDWRSAYFCRPLMSDWRDWFVWFWASMSSLTCPRRMLCSSHRTMIT